MKPRSNQNQVHPPLPKKKRVDAQGNDRKRMILKDHGATMIIAEGCTAECYACAWERFKKDIEAGGGRTLVGYKSIM